MAVSMSFLVSFHYVIYCLSSRYFFLSAANPWIIAASLCE
jgi:hypothetical protein